MFHFGLVPTVFMQTAAVQIRPCPDGEHRKNLQAHPLSEQELRPEQAVSERYVWTRQAFPQPYGDSPEGSSAPSAETRRQRGGALSSPRRLINGAAEVTEKRWLCVVLGHAATGPPLPAKRSGAGARPHRRAAPRLWRRPAYSAGPPAAPPRACAGTSRPAPLRGAGPGAASGPSA